MKKFLLPPSYFACRDILLKLSRLQGLILHDARAGRHMDPTNPIEELIPDYKPDVITEKGVQRKIHEVEASDSVDSKRGTKQQSAFRQLASQNKNTTFKRNVTNK